ncbi:hypothetical protein JW964_13920 [candidate division KSB1 bacterium]|nr:hypothetical protein [candidate division KSB1 bacterium]
MIEKNERDLLVVSFLYKGEDQRLGWLYKFLEESAVDLAKLYLGLHYRKIHVLEKSQVTYLNFIDNITNLASDREIKALDVFLHLHGGNGKLTFYEKTPENKLDIKLYRTSEISKTLREKNLNRKLRILYSTACFGQSHLHDFIYAGFRVACGAISVNANTAIEYPLFMTHWLSNSTFSTSVMAAHQLDGIMTKVQDEIANGQGFPDANSFKIILGKGYTKITSPAY